MGRKKMSDKEIFELAEKFGDWDDFGRWTFKNDDRLLSFVDAVQKAEREACAKVCEEIYTGEEACGDWPTPEMCAKAIRKRGEK
jgi:hypothetical protein